MRERLLRRGGLYNHGRLAAIGVTVLFVSASAPLGATSVGVSSLTTSHTAPPSNSHAATAGRSAVRAIPKIITTAAGSAATFGSATSFSTTCCVSGAIHSFAVADVNRDGIPDLVSANPGGRINQYPGVVVALGNGDGTFRTPVLYSVPDGVLSVAIGDVNGDGFPDVVAAEANNTQKIDVLLGNGDGTFQSPSVVTATTAGGDVRLGDLNGDGKLDIVLTGASHVGVLLGNGDGTFGAETAYPTHGGAASATIADLNGDGRPDIVVADGNAPGADPATVGIMLNTGGGTFSGEGLYAVGNTYAQANHVVVADLNGDGVPDLVASVGSCCFNSSDVKVLLGTGGGTFSAATALGDAGTVDMDVADVNGDGIPDVVSSNPAGYANSTNQVNVYLGNGNGSFAAPTSYLTNQNDANHFLLMRDLNRDGKADIMTANSGTFTEILNTTAGQFVPLGGPLTLSELFGGSNFCFQCWLDKHAHSQIADPVEAESGNFTETATDLSVPGRGIPLALTRTYNSQAASTVGPLGYGWTMDYGASLAQNSTSGLVTVSQENGSQVLFAKVGTAIPAAYAPVAPRTVATLVNNADGTWTFTRLGNERLVFSATGQVTSMSDRNGYTTTLAYAGGQLIQVTEPAGRTFSLTYTGAVLTKVNDDQTGRHVVYGYSDGAGNLTDVTDVNGGNTHYTYETGHLLDTVRDSRGNTVTTNHYNGATPPQVGWQRDGLLRQTSFVYGSGGSSTTVTDPKGNVTLDTFVSGLKTSETRGYGSPQAATWTYVYDQASAAPLSITDPNGHTSYYTYDSSGNVLTTTDALSRTTITTYNSFEEPVTQTDPMGVTTTLTYDSNGNELTSSRPLTGTSQVQVAANHYGDTTHPGDVTSNTDPAGRTSSFAYDTYGDLVSATDPMGDRTTHTYNSDGWLLSDVSPKGHVAGCGCASQYTTAYSYVIPGSGVTDEWGDVQTVTDPLGHTVTNGYDLDRNSTTFTDGDGNLTTYVFDAAGELTTVQRPGSPATTLVTDYNLDGTVKDQKDGKGDAIQTYGYNSLAQVVAQIDALGNETDYTYDGVGNHLTKQDPGGHCPSGAACTTNSYDAANQLLGVTYSDGTTPNVTTITYDADGQKRSWSDGTGSWSQAFDSLHHLISVTEGRYGTVGYAYDLRNLPTSITYPGGTHTVTETYDDAARWTSVKDWNGNLTTIAYDANSNLTTTTLPPAAAGIDAYSYNAADQLTSIVDTAGATAVFSATYTRDANGQLTGDTSAATAQTAFKYSVLNQLCYAAIAASTPCSASPPGSESFTYDAADNLANLGNTAQQFNAADELCWTGTGASISACSTAPPGATTYGYDARGNRTAQVPLTGAATCDTYDQADRLTAIRTGTGSSCSSAGSVATYNYNAAGLRMSKTAGGATTNQVWDTARSLPLLLEDQTSATTVDYVYGPGGLPLERVSGATALWYHHDQVGSTRAITDGVGAVQATYRYDPFGKTVASTGSLPGVLLFSGQYQDAESGLYYLRARYYDPTTAQFFTRDPMVSSTREPYSYTADNPLNRSDPIGLGWCDDNAHVRGHACSTLAGSTYQGPTKQCVMIGGRVSSTDSVEVEAGESCQALASSKTGQPSYEGIDPADEGRKPDGETCSFDPGTGFSHCTQPPGELENKITSTVYGAAADVGIACTVGGEVAAAVTIADVLHAFWDWTHW